MIFSPELIALATYLAGEFDNQAQASAEPVWYVHLRLWQRPVPIFLEDSLTLFIEQASVVNLDKPYRQRIARLRAKPSAPSELQVEYYMFKDPNAFRGAGSNPELLRQIKASDIELLPGCTLDVSQQLLTPSTYKFSAVLPASSRCCFTYQGEIRQVFLGFEATPAELLSYDKGIEPATGKALWGAVLGPFRFAKCQDFSSELPVG